MSDLHYHSLTECQSVICSWISRVRFCWGLSGHPSNKVRSWWRSIKYIDVSNSYLIVWNCQAKHWIVVPNAPLFSPHSNRLKWHNSTSCYYIKSSQLPTTTSKIVLTKDRSWLTTLKMYGQSVQLLLKCKAMLAKSFLLTYIVRT